MKKRVFGTILAAALIVSQAVSVFAAGSKTGEMAIAGDSIGWYELVEVTEENLPDLAASAPDVMDKIEAVNSGAETLQSVGDLAPDLAGQLEGKVMLTRFYGIIPINGGVQTDDGRYLVNLSVPALTGSVSEVKLLYYSAAKNAWEILEPTNIDYANKIITIVLEDLYSPIAVIGKVSGGADASVGTSPKTGMTFGWAAWLGAAVVLGVTGTVIYRKARQ